MDGNRVSGFRRAAVFGRAIARDPSPKGEGAAQIREKDHKSNVILFPDEPRPTPRRRRSANTCRSRPQENRTDEIAVKHQLLRQGSLLPGDLGDDDPAFRDGRQHVGNVVKIDSDTRRVARRDEVEALAKAPPPAQHGCGVKVPHLPVEKAILVAVRSDKTTRMTSRQVGQYLRQQLQAYQEAVQGILIELICASEQVIEERVLALDVADQQGLGELALVFEVIEKAVLGDANGSDQLVDRCSGEALFENGGFSRIENAVSRVAALAMLEFLHDTALRVNRASQLHHESS